MICPSDSASGKEVISMEMLNAPVSHSAGQDDLFVVETLQATTLDGSEPIIGGGGSSNCNCNSNCNGSSEEPFL
jgi:hypothetical protein